VFIVSISPSWLKSVFAAISSLVHQMAPRNHGREGAVKALNRCAAFARMARLPENAGKPRVEAFIQGLQGHAIANAWPAAEQAQLQKAAADYAATWPAPAVAAATAVEADKTIEWKFTALQATYNCTTGEWASPDRAVQRGLFDRVLAYVAKLASSLDATGNTAKMEWSTESMQHVHVHFYMPSTRRV